MSELVGLCVFVCVSVYGPHIISTVLESTRSECILRTLCDGPVIGLKMSQEISTVTLEEDFADFQPYLPVLVIGMSYLLCPQYLAMFCVFRQPAVAAYLTSAIH